MSPEQDNLMMLTGAVLREAGRIILSSSVTRSQIEKKGDNNYVTEIDYRVQEYLAIRLESIIPGSHLIAEESEKNLFSVDSPSWILDPVDGTTNLIYDYRFSAISLALYLEGKPAYGFVYNPYLDELFQARAGVGAWLDDEPVYVSDTAELAHALIGFGTNPYDRANSGQTFAMIEDVFTASMEIRRSGSAALDMAYVACGRLNGFFEQMLQPWDFAAGSIIVEAAGGVVRGWDGMPLKNLLEPSGIIAASANIYAPLNDILDKHR
jgi:myo-inositol-1(or 4)-monophosphatase